jgi:hypothetical protein
MESEIFRRRAGERETSKDKADHWTRETCTPPELGSNAKFMSASFWLSEVKRSSVVCFGWNSRPASSSRIINTSVSFSVMLKNSAFGLRSWYNCNKERIDIARI